ncbi:hypothetical protein [Pseudomonas serbica]|uniref:hypothetical protein n=1 Tax=Pseudomonas serbica TaxID=2965074 RepID=UPI00237A7113|nr:hypothetical protein [Pseudomonas serbica]
MLVLNPRTAMLSYEDQDIPAEDVLMFIDAEFDLSPDSPAPLTLLTMKRLLLNYPLLQQLNGWAEALLEDAEGIRPRLVNSASLQPQIGDPGFTHLELQKTRIATFSELTLVKITLDIDEKVININGEVPAEMTATYEDVPSVTITDEVNLYGIKGSSRYSLAMTRLHQIFYLPIVLAPALNVQAMEVATEDRTAIEQSATSRIKILQDGHQISLRELLHAVLMDMNLDHEELYEIDRETLMTEIAKAELAKLSDDGQEAAEAVEETEGS